MSKILGAIQLTRPLNVLMIGLSQALYYFFILKVMYAYSGLQPELDTILFLCVCIATMCIAAAGNVWNDINDIETDSINRTDRVLVRKVLTSDWAFNFYLVLNLIAIVLLIYVNYTTKVLSPMYLFLLSISSLWIYSSQWKKQGILGNFTISVLAALPLWAVFLYHKKILHITTPIQAGLAKLLLLQTIVYSAFAFLLTFCRELVKDIEDLKGDKTSGSKSVPIVLGIRATKWIITFLVTLILISSTYLAYLYLTEFEFFHFVYVLLDASYYW